MRTILGLLGVVAIAVLAVLAFQWWNGNNAAITIAYPTDGTTLGGNTVPVRLNANQDIKNKLNAPGSQTEIVTYLDDKEVGRSKELNYNLTTIAPGEHKLSIGLSDQTGSNNGVSLNIMPKPVSFTLGGGSGANQNVNSLPPGVNNGAYNSDANAVPPPATPTPVVYEVPAATPVPAATQAPALPASGMGGMSRSNSVAKVQPAATNNQAVQSINNSQPKAVSNAQQAAIAEGSQSQLVLASTQVNTDAVVAADRASETNSNDNPLSVAFRWIGAFYVAGFIVALGAILVIQRRRS